MYARDAVEPVLPQRTGRGLHQEPPRTLSLSSHDTLFGKISNLVGFIGSKLFTRWSSIEWYNNILQGASRCMRDGYNTGSLQIRHSAGCVTGE